MKLGTLVITAILVLLAPAAAFTQAKLSTRIPHLQKRGTATQLIVDGVLHRVEATRCTDVCVLAAYPLADKATSTLR